MLDRSCIVNPSIGGAWYLPLDLRSSSWHGFPLAGLGVAGSRRLTQGHVEAIVPRVAEARGGRGASVAILEHFEAQRRIRDAAKDRFHITMTPNVLDRMRRTKLDFAMLRLVLRAVRVESAEGEQGNRKFRAVGEVDGIHVGVEVQLFAMGDGSDRLRISDVWKL
jgi:hypothetical protein